MYENIKTSLYRYLPAFVRSAFQLSVDIYLNESRAAILISIANYFDSTQLQHVQLFCFHCYHF